MQEDALGIFCRYSSIEVRKNNLESVSRGTCHTRGASVGGQTVILNLVHNTLPSPTCRATVDTENTAMYVCIGGS